MTVCHGVFFGGFDDANAFVNSIEYNTLMGAQHFFAYVMDVGANVKKVTDFYESENMYSVFSMPEFPAKKAWYHGQVVAVNDCIQRNKGLCLSGYLTCRLFVCLSVCVCVFVSLCVCVSVCL